MKRIGMTLVEVVASTLLVGVLLSAALTTVSATSKTWTVASQTSDAYALAAQLLTEILASSYADVDQPIHFGPESDETSLPPNRAAFDDTDDFDGWGETPPTDASGASLAGYSGWVRKVEVTKIDPSSRFIRNDQADDQGMRMVSVTVTAPGGQTVTLKTVRTQNGGYAQTQGTAQKQVTWVGLRLQSGSASAVTSGVSLINHASDQ